MTKLKGYAVQYTDKETGEICYAYAGRYKASIYGAIFKDRKKAESYLDSSNSWATVKIVEVDITIKD